MTKCCGKCGAGIDEDGDGRYDIQYRAKENGIGEEAASDLRVYWNCLCRDFVDGIASVQMNVKKT